MKLKVEHFYSPDKKRIYNQWLFSLIAAEYGSISQILSFGMDRYWKQDLIKNLSVLEPVVILDCACGTGDLSIMLSTKFSTSKILAIDLSHKMLKRLVHRLKPFHAVSVVLADVCNMPVPHSCCDLVTGGYVLRNAPDLKGFLFSVYNVLKPGGQAAFLDFSKYSNSLLHQIQYVLLWIWGGFRGLLLHRNPQVYGYIAESLKVFPDEKMLETLMIDAGFESVATRKYLFGMIAIVFCRKPI
jgi:demethylmenaquinone methyltransferase/2-methoxy-6-polyprenyl-1,4-benzoquinol methylase